MNRREEYEVMLEELGYIPEALETSVERALKREKASQKRWRGFTLSATSFAACFLAFVLLVNVFPPFAKACEDIPILGELAKAVNWSPSLSAAVENEYVQPIGKSQTVNGITATIEYLIVDQKQVNIFFTLKGDYENLTGEMPEFFPEQHCGISVNDFRDPPGTLLRYTLDYGDEDVPSGFTMTFGVTTYVEPDLETMAAPVEDAYDDMFVPHEEERQEILAEFTFDLEFDPDFTAEGEIIPVHTDFELDGQILSVTEVAVYPTHVRVEIEGASENTAWLKGVQFYMENEAGERFEPISNGVSATGDPDSPAMLSFRLESPYFAKSDHLTLCITQAEWLDKELGRVRVDLERGYMDRKIEGVELLNAEKREDGWLLSFKVRRIKEDHSFSVFGHRFYDAEGKEYDSHSRATSWISEEYFEEILPLPDYYHDVVWLEPYYTHRTDSDPAIAVPIK
ncbi:MAG: DUF4179 domain-containing protein [Oscillibacter sp.]|nr:DUF4179 domain-containing protein [Oscillibacter sp.]